jgi:hypothetical protein
VGWVVSTVALAAIAGCGRSKPIGEGAHVPVGDAGPDVPSADVGAPPVDADASAADADGAARDADASTPDTAEAPPPDAADAPPEVLSEPRPRVRSLAQAVTLGRDHTCALLDDGRVKCWGRGHYGDLGYGDQQDRGKYETEMGDAMPAVDLGTGRTAIQLDAGNYSTCAVLDDHSLKCWGLSLRGVDDAHASLGMLADVPEETGDGLPIMELGPGRTAKSVAVGDNGACVLRDDGSLRCWSKGVPAPADLSAPAGRRIIAMTGTIMVGLLFDDGTASEVGFNGDDPPTLTLLPFDLGAGRRAVALASNARYRPLCAVLEGGGFVCRNGYAPPPELSTADLAGFAFTEFTGVCALYVDGHVDCLAPLKGNEAWVEPGADPLQPVHTIKLGMRALDLEGGGFQHRCALLADHSVRCWSELLNLEQPWLGATFPDSELPDAGASARWLPIDLGTRPAD